ncbi:MAG: MFS transporter [Rubripirellula sp.]
MSFLFARCGGQEEPRIRIREPVARILSSISTGTVVSSVLPASESNPSLTDDSPWAPLRVPLFRAFWFASIVSNLGTWVHEVGASWLMTNLDASPEMVSAVRIAISVPTILLAIPAGVIADRVDRRMLLILTQLVLLITTSTLAAMTFNGMITSWMLLGLTFVIGLGTVLHVLNWQSTIPELVPKEQLSRAISLGSISFNLARAVGPAIGGVLIAFAGVWIAFAVNAVSFAGVLGVLFFWKRERKESSQGQSLIAALSEGLRFVRDEPVMRNVLIAVAAFLLPATALWSLLPLVARQQLGWQADGFGMLVTMLGVGAVVAARFLHWMHLRFGRDRTVTVAMMVFAVGMALIGLATNGWLAFLATFIMGGSWMMTLTTLNSTAQMKLPNELRARGMGCYITAVAISMATGALLWGQVAGSLGLAATQWIAAGTLVGTSLARMRLSLEAT